MWARVLPGRLMELPAESLPLWRRIRRRAYWIVVLVLLRLADLVPITWGRALGVGFARLALVLRPTERRRARVNLSDAFPHLDSESVERLVSDSAAALGRNFFDTLAAGRLLADVGCIVEEPNEDTGNLPLVEVIEELMTAGRGVLILGGHLGCWELLGGWLAVQLDGAGCGPLGAVTGTVHNPPVNRILQDRRRALGLKVLPRDQGLGPLLRHLRGGRAVAVLLDQNTRVPNVQAPFFGRMAPTPTGFGNLALRNGVPVLPVSIARVDERHVVRHLAPMLPAAVDPVSEMRLLDFLTDCNGSLERMIRRNPAEWVWFHRRWN